MLTISQVKAAKPKDKPYKLTDTNQLYLLISVAGTKTFKLDYQVEGKRRTLILGTFPELGLAEAREKATEAKRLIKRGMDPNIRASKQLRFAAIAREFCEFKEWGPKHKQVRRLEIYVYPSIGNANINDIEPPELLAIVRPIEAKGTGETAHRVLNLIGQVYRYAIQCGYARVDKTYGLSGALKPVKGGHFEAITDPDEIRQVYKAFDEVFSPVTRNALKMALLTAVRPGELRAMQWADIDLKSALWSYTVNKTNTQHIVPLSTQAIEILREMRTLTGLDKYVFCSLRGADKDRPLSDTGLLMALQRLGVKSTTHGFRASFRTICSEVLDFPDHLLEHQLAHRVRDPLGNAYNRTKHLDKRKVIMQAWADFLSN